MTPPFARRPEPHGPRNWHPVTGSAGAADFNDRVLGDAALVRRVGRGDEEAASILVERLTPAVLKAVRRRMPRWASEEDLVQTVFAKVFSKLHQYSGAVPLECWVMRIALNTSLNQIAYESVRPEWRMCDLNAEQERSLENWTEPDGEADEQREARELVDLMLSQLKPDERLIITLLHIEQRSTKEISLMTGLSIALIKVKAFRTRRKMQRLGRRLVK
jgi:RNA polymerase sigma factor (sigma-70 family)